MSLPSPVLLTSVTLMDVLHMGPPLFSQLDASQSSNPRQLVTIYAGQQVEAGV